MKGGAAVYLAMMLATPAVAQTASPTQMVKVAPIVQSERGKAHTCGIEYRMVVTDHAYKQGGSVALNGSISLMYSKGREPVVTLKLRSFDVELRDANVQLIAFAPEYAYFSMGGASSAGKERIKFTCEGGGFCAGYTDIPILEAAIGTMYGQPFKVAFSRIGGKTDVVAEVAPFALNEEGSKELSDCLDTVLKRIEVQD